MATYPLTIRLLISLSNKECKKFKAYLCSPYFNTVERLPKVYELIIDEFKEKQKEFNEPGFIEKVYTKSSERTYKSDLSKLKKHFEKFIILQEIEEKEQDFNHLILKDYINRVDGCFFEKKYHKVKNLLEEKPIDHHYYQSIFQIEEHFDTYIKSYKDNRTGDSNLQAISDAIDLDFILKKMCFGVLMLNRTNIAETDYNFGMMSAVLTYLKANQQIDNPLIRLLYYAYEILSGRNEEIMLQNLNEELRRSDKKIPIDMLNILYTILQNNLKRINGVKSKLHKELFKLYEFMLNQKYGQTNGNLPVTFYKNVVSIGLELNKYDYVNELIEKYKDKLMPVELANETYAYNKAKYLIYIDKPEQARDFIQNIKFKDWILKFDLKCIKIMLSYDLKELMLLEALINAFDVSLTPKRSPVKSEPNTIVYKKFISYVKKMNRIYKDPNLGKKDVEKLVLDIEKTYQCSNRNWLLKRLKTLL